MTYEEALKKQEENESLKVTLTNPEGLLDTRINIDVLTKENAELKRQLRKSEENLQKFQEAASKEFSQINQTLGEINAKMQEIETSNEMLNDNMENAADKLAKTMIGVCDTHLGGFDKSILQVKSAAKAYTNAVTQDIRKSLKLLKSCTVFIFTGWIVPMIAGLWFILPNIF